MKQIALLLYLLPLVYASCSGQQKTPLKSFDHALKMIQSEVDKNDLIREMKFEDGNNDTIDVVRLDHIGTIIFPLIISSKLPIATDSLGIYPIRMHKDSLEGFMEMINGVTPKMYSREKDGVLIRVTYRYEKQNAQYYITNARIVTEFLKMIERRLITYNDKFALNSFYDFAARTELLKGVKGKPAWKY
jgi:hypothetical protein